MGRFSKTNHVLVIYFIIGSSFLFYIYDQQKSFTIPFHLLKNEFHDELCPNITFENLTESKGIKNSRIALVIPISSASDYPDYQLALDTLECYVEHFGYYLALINMTSEAASYNCTQKDVFFKRHCVVANFMEQNLDKFEYVLFLDADIGVINPCHTIQEFIDDSPDVHITFYDRYFDDEIAAGSYLIKNSEYSRNFLHFWADYKLPKSFHGTDNGAIHQVFMDLQFNDTNAQKRCYKLWERSKNFDTLFEYEACVRYALGNLTYFMDGKVKVVRKGTWGWIRDGWLTKTKFARNDFMFHGWKKKKLGSEWVWPFNDTVFNMEECSPRSSFSSWVPKDGFLRSNNEIRQLLDEYAREVFRKYKKILRKLRLNK